MKRPWFLLLACFLITSCGPSPEASPTPFTPAATNQETATVPPAPSETETPSATQTTSASPSLEMGASQVSAVDSMVLLHVSAGIFSMGDEGGYRDERPVHEVELPAYWVDQTEVTNGMYALCEAAGACARPARKNSNVIDLYYGSTRYENYPVVYINWQDAIDYCGWAGRRLPTEAEWEKAARGTDGRIYPWGNTTPDNTLANFDHDNPDPVAVGSYPAGASPYGALDMAGNVFEWVADWYAGDYYAIAPLFAPFGPESGIQRVTRGGSWRANAMGTRAAHRFIHLPDEPDFDLGFRCVMNALP